MGEVLSITELLRMDQQRDEARRAHWEERMRRLNTIDAANRQLTAADWERALDHVQRGPSNGDA